MYLNLPCKMKMYVLKLLVVFSVSLIVANAEEVPIVKTQLGVIKGEAHAHTFRGREYTTNQFFGIPYAKPPVGSLRFQRPERHEGFSEPFEATKFGSKCPQHDMVNIGTVSGSEDCLYLNIYVPTRQKDNPKGFAVMISIHGGGLYAGYGDMYNGETLSAYGNVIVVTINYRLGIFALANTGDDKAKGNMGFWDQQLAIQWVNEHIASFGGDPSRVTLFGQSAGAYSVFVQGMFPQNKGLFQNLIAQSGSPTMPFEYKENNIHSLTFVAGKLNCSTETIDTIYACLQDASAESILTKMMEVTDYEDMLKVHLFPTLDGEFFPRPPLETLQQSRENPTDEVKFLRSLNLINGVNDADGAMWLQMVFGNVDDVDNFVMSQDDLKNGQMSSILKEVTKGGPVSELLLSVVSSTYTDWSNPSNARAMFVKLMGDHYYNVPSVENSMSHANDSASRSWMYYFRAQLGIRLLPLPSWVKGANHGDELIPQFGFALSDFGLALNITDYIPQEWELDLAESLMTLWSNFAKEGNPDPDWPQYDIESQKYLSIDKQNSVGQYLFQEEVNFWRDIVPQILAVEHTHSGSPFSSKSSDTCDADGNCG